MSKEQFILGLVTVCVTLVGIVGGTAWWLNDTIHTSSNQVRADLTQSINKVEVNMTQSFGEVRGDIRVLGTRMNSVEKKVDNLEVKVDGVEKKVDSLEVKVDSLEEKVDGVEKKVDSLEVKVDGLEDDIRDNNEYLREREIQSVPNDASINDASMSKTPIPKEDPAKLRKISAENKP